MRGMAPILEKPQAAVTTCMISRLIQVDEDAGMTQWSVPAVAERGASSHSDRRHLSDQVDRKTRIHLLFPPSEFDQTIVALCERLQDTGTMFVVRVSIMSIRLVPVQYEFRHHQSLSLQVQMKRKSHMI